MFQSPLMQTLQELSTTTLLKPPMPAAMPVAAPKPPSTTGTPKRSRSKGKYAPGAQAKFGAILVVAYESLTKEQKAKVGVPVSWDLVMQRLVSEHGTCLLCEDESKAPISNNWKNLLEHVKKHGEIGDAMESIRGALQEEMANTGGNKMPLEKWPARLTLARKKGATKNLIRTAYSNFMTEHGADLKAKGQPWNSSLKRKKMKEKEQKEEELEEESSGEE